MNGYSQRYEDALVLAATVHHDQLRKQTDIPYSTHLFHVSLILIRYGFDEDTAIAGLLHDIVEDQQYPLIKIQEQFGTKVASIVAALTEKKRDESGNPRPWEVRKQEGMDLLAHASVDAVATKVADALHNVSTISANLQREGDSVWKRFSRGAAQSIWYYHHLLVVARGRLGEHPLVEEYAAAVEQLCRLASISSEDLTPFDAEEQ